MPVTSLAIQMPQVFSASRISTWMTCRRKAMFEYVCGLRGPATGAQDLGVQVHKYLEWLHANSGADVDLTTDVGKIAASILPFVYDIWGASVAEGEFHFSGRFPWLGFIDLLAHGQVVDYKTSSDPNKWAKTPEDLRVDPQAVLYAKHAFAKFPELDVVILRWVYGRTKPPGWAMPVEIMMTREDADRGFEAMESYAAEMQAATDASPTDPVEKYKFALAQEPNYDACDSYGGCPHKSRCNPPFFNNKEPKKVNLFERLQQMEANGTPATAADPIKSTIVVSWKNAPDVVIPDPPAPAGEVERKDAEVLAPNPLRPTEIPTAILPPAINPPKRGRPAGSKNKPNVARDRAPVSPRPPRRTRPRRRRFWPSTARRPRRPPTPTPRRPRRRLRRRPRPAYADLSGVVGINTLYIGCAPEASDFIDFDMILASARDMIGDASYYGNFGYKTNGMMLEAVKKIMSPVAYDRVVVRHPQQPESLLCLSYLRGIAVTVVS
jgi:hypothetical protein